MKKRSKLFLLVAGIIFSLGMMICLIGVGVASSTGEQIYAEKIGEERGYTYDFSEIDKVKISVTDADINIYGGCEKSYVEIINFNENLCSYSGNNAMITFREATEVEDITGIWESGLSFKGLRYILRPVTSDKKKIVNIYLADSEHVKAFDLDLGRGNVAVSDIKAETDYDISLESGKISFTDVATESSVDIKAAGDISTDISFMRVSADMVTVNAKRAKFTGESFSSDACEMTVTAGSATFDFMPKKEAYTVDIATKGKLTVDDEVYLDKFSYPPKDAPVTTEPDGEEVESSYLKIEGNDFSVNLDTPVGDVGTDTEEITE